jgi:hypothetical protein
VKGLADPDELESFVEFCKERALQTFNQRGRVTPHALVLGTVHPDLGELEEAVAFPCVPVEMIQGERERAGFIDFVRRLALDTKAVGVIFVTEVWFACAIADDIAAVRRMCERVDGRQLEDLDDRHEGILISVDHLAYGHTVRWIASVIRDANGRGRATRFETVPPEDTIVRDRFSEAFPRELWQ